MSTVTSLNASAILLNGKRTMANSCVTVGCANCAVKKQVQFLLCSNEPGVTAAVDSCCMQEGQEA